MQKAGQRQTNTVRLHLCQESRVGKFREMESRLVGVKGREREMRNDCFMCIGFPFGRDGNVTELQRDGGCTTL